MATVKQVLGDCAVETWEKLGAAAKLGVPFGEETITDLNMLAIVGSGVKAIKVLTAPKRLEAKYGFDWEWWVGSNAAGWLQYAIQAKKYNLAKKRYAKFRHKVNRQWQITRLKRYCIRNGAIPLYCLYNSNVKIPAGAKCVHLPAEQFGCTLASIAVAEHFHKSGSVRTFANLHSNQETYPWSCFMQNHAAWRKRIQAGKDVPLLQGYKEARGVEVRSSLPSGLLSLLAEGKAEYASEMHEDGEPYPKRTAIIEQDD